MLQLKNIVKDYVVGDTRVEALRGIDLEFRKSEFVSILGPSGCGKTTLLNIIGGLDRYTSGDLVINGVSTKKYRDGDWDVYRNRSIGFVFQSYNLISHQTVLANVELAMTLSGVSKEERRRRAIEVLQQVGLGDQLKKKPNEMSGGQMQRVAIARALVNNPDILLADEPTGALDSATSVQIMDLLKEIAKDRLVIMVTHNPELAETYSTRIIRLLDGKVTDDSSPYSAKEEKGQEGKRKKVKKKPLSLATAFGLSMNNLMTKKARTFLTSFAGSIGIIGIALILSLSNGIQAYIDSVQEDTLSTYPITLEAETMDMGAMITSFMGAEGTGGLQSHEKDAVYSNSVIYELMNSMNTAGTTANNLTLFKDFLEDESSGVGQYATAIHYSYDIPMNIYTTDENGKIVKSDMDSLMTAIVGDTTAGMMNSMSSMSAMGTVEIWEELLPGEDGQLVNGLVQEQYDVIYGAWPQNYNEVVLVVTSNNELSDIALHALGLKTTEEMKEISDAAFSGQEIDTTVEKWSYEEICAKEFKLILPGEYYQHDALSGGYTDVSQTDRGLEYLFNSENVGMNLKVVGIVRPNEDATATMLTGSVGYTAALTEKVIALNSQLDVVKSQLDDPAVDVIQGLPFATGEEEELTDAQKVQAAMEYIGSLDTAAKADVYTQVVSVPEDSYIQQMVDETMAGMTREYIEETIVQQYAQEMGVDASTVQEYIAQMTDEELMSMVRQSVEESARAQYAQGVQAQLAAMSAEELAYMLDAGLTDSQYVWVYANLLPPAYSEGSYEENLELLGHVDMESPSAIHLYAATFADKSEITDLIEGYNAAAEEEDKITYTDYVELLMSSVTTIINAISYVLIAFVAISLVVSSIMIGIITYISVLERTKEIGVLRSVGASKKDVARVFNAETLIVGFVAGAIGIGFTLLLTLPINAIIRALTGIPTLGAKLPWMAGVILVGISMLLTFIAGLVPSRLAAKKDPVTALRTE